MVLKIRLKGTQVKSRHPSVDSPGGGPPLTRAPINVESVSTVAPAQGFKNSAGQEIAGIGYIRIREFTARTPQELDEAIKEQQSAGAAIILDLRGNPGGLLTSVVNVADMFLDKGHDPHPAQQGRARAELHGQDRRLDQRAGRHVAEQVQRQRRRSARRALQDNRRAQLVGEVSFGKATVNIARELKDGGAIFVSIAQWLTPNGALIDKVGIRPDVEVVPTDEDIDLRRDPRWRGPSTSSRASCGHRCLTLH
jgi:carboxyl-terminal processing protease